MTVLGLDIGGANIKAAHANGWAQSTPFALWRRPEQLPNVLRRMVRNAPAHSRIAVTMTGELCDCFETKAQGVAHILRAVEGVADSSRVSVWLTTGQFVSLDLARDRPFDAAAANWHALATWLATELVTDRPAILVDCGSTTTDIVPLAPGRILTRSRTDMDRLATAELIYIGARRTPLMAFGESVVLGGQTIHIMNECFATLDDVMLLLGHTAEQPDDCDTTDNRPRTKAHAAARIARMIGADRTMLAGDQVIELARAFHCRAVDRIVRAIRQVSAPHGIGRVIISGSGDQLALAACERVCEVADYVLLAEQYARDISIAAAAYALTQLGLDS